jgi:hypothetical protein
MSDKSFAADFAAEAAKGTPPVTVAATSITGWVDWDLWVYVLTALFLLMQIALLGWKLWDRAWGKNRPGD